MFSAKFQDPARNVLINTPQESPPEAFEELKDAAEEKGVCTSHIFRNTSESVPVGVVPKSRNAGPQARHMGNAGLRAPDDLSYNRSRNEANKLDFSFASFADTGTGHSPLKWSAAFGLWSSVF